MCSFGHDPGPEEAKISGFMNALICIVMQGFVCIHAIASVYTVLTAVIVNTLPFSSIAFPLGAQS